MKQRFKDKHAILESIRQPFYEPKSSIKERLAKNKIQNFDELFVELVNNGFIQERISDENKKFVFYSISKKGQEAFANELFLELGAKDSLDEKHKKAQIRSLYIGLVIGGISLLVGIIKCGK